MPKMTKREQEMLSVLRGLLARQDHDGRTGLTALRVPGHELTRAEALLAELEAEQRAAEGARGEG